MNAHDLADAERRTRDELARLPATADREEIGRAHV